MPEALPSKIQCGDHVLSAEWKLGGSVRSKNLTAQFNEVLCKILVYNITVVTHEMYRVEIEPEFFLYSNEDAF